MIRNFLDDLRRTAGLNGSRTATIDGRTGDALDWAAMDRRSDDAAAFLAARGVGAGRAIHYPQVFPHGTGFILDLSLKARDGSFTVMRGFSADGLTFGDWNEDMPRTFRRGLAHRIRRRLRRHANASPWAWRIRTSSQARPRPITTPIT